MTFDHGTTEEIDGVIFCIPCGFETDHDPLREGLLRERESECPAFCASRRKDPIFKRRTGPKKPKKEYIPISPSEVTGGINEPYKEAKDQILRCLGLWDEK